MNRQAFTQGKKIKTGRNVDEEEKNSETKRRIRMSVIHDKSVNIFLLN